MRKRDLIVNAASACLVLLCLPSQGRADVTLVIPSATNEEMEQLGAALNGAISPTAYNEIIRIHPSNRAAHLLRALGRLQSGDVKGAREDLDFLSKYAPDFPGLASTVI